MPPSSPCDPDDPELSMCEDGICGRDDLCEVFEIRRTQGDECDTSPEFGGASVLCDPLSNLVCVDGACAMDESDDDCAGEWFDYWCMAAQRMPGAACDRDALCSSGVCGADGVCAVGLCDAN
jgi:hypothetical protein